MYAANDLYGMAEVYVRLLEFGYNRSSVSMCCANKEERLKVINKVKKSYTIYENITGQYIGNKVQIDIKYVPRNV